MPHLAKGASARCSAHTEKSFAQVAARRSHTARDRDAFHDASIEPGKKLPERIGLRKESGTPKGSVRTSVSDFNAKN
jgi:hypothetical protein